MSQGSLWLESVVEYEMSRGVGDGNREAGKVLKLALSLLIALKSVCVFKVLLSTR